MVFKVGNDLVYNLDRCIALALGVANLFRIAVALLDEVVAVYPAVLAVARN